MRILRLLRSIAVNRRGGVPAPSWCTYLVTYRCNARCRMCDSYAIDPGKELTPDEVGTVFGRIGSLDVVRLSGGEPFLRPDFAELAEAVLQTSDPAVIHISTNGSLPDRIETFVGKFSRPRRLRFMISFDGLEATHDANRGKAVRFEQAMTTLDLLVGLRARHGLEVSANHTVISPASLSESDELKRRLGERGVDVQTVLAYEDSAMYGAERRGKAAGDLTMATGYPLHRSLHGCDCLGFTETELAATRRIRSLLLRLGKRYYLEGLRARLAGEAKPRPNPRCAALRSHIRLLPGGDVPVCQFNTAIVGNLLANDFARIWQGDCATRQRAWVDRCPGCWAECEVIPSAIYSGDIARFALLGS